MASINIILDIRRLKKDNTYPVKFRFWINNLTFDLSTGISSSKENFNSKNLTIKKDPNSSLILEELRSKYLNRLREFEAEHQNQPTSLKLIKSYFIQKPKESITIKEFWMSHIDKLRAVGKIGNARTYKITLSALSSAINLDTHFHNIKHSCIIDLEHKLLLRGMSANGISVYLRTFRAIFNKAIEQDITSQDNYPFKKFKIKKEKTTPRVMTITEMKSYFSLDLKPESTYYSSFKIGKLILMLRGINLRDLLVLNKTNIKSNRIIYKRSKTGKICSILITEEIQQLLSSFNSNDCTLLGFINKEQMEDLNNFSAMFHQKRKVINSHLKKIGMLIKSTEPVTTYVFRYTYANIAKQLGYSKDLIGEALSHTTGNAVTGIYLEQYDLALVDEMNMKVIDTVA